MDSLDLTKLDIVVAHVPHGPDYIHDLLCLMGDCVTNSEELEEFEYYAKKVEDEYKFIIQRLEHCESERFNRR